MAMMLPPAPNRISDAPNRLGFVWLVKVRLEI